MLKLIKTEVQYEDTLARVYELMQLDLQPDTKESDELEILSMLVKKYEEEHYPVPEPTPLEAIKYKMEQMKISDAELSEILGARSRKSEILSGKRKLSLSMIRALKERLNISADILIQLY
ncbi:XRE family transcriptional regulator [Flavobacterium rivuli WB 3.3-2 = DSM 21788]|uniref:XRE family transcriptional regulator n=1 Tax=Flavobacterium rivuli WB 3.3-2 = DSM 21788 TaxID=1121895 RepID=A0A0A2M142_9FLAO|nr:transcriptional regulator [Flavobacterium rivuli]KGO85994.1 XRE family transcriptional regulator [Flavobacterium rivuli WB 3.3-2 = DSM 21788]